MRIFVKSWENFPKVGKESQTLEFSEKRGNVKKEEMHHWLWWMDAPGGELSRPKQGKCSNKNGKIRPILHFK